MGKRGTWGISGGCLRTCAGLGVVYCSDDWGVGLGKQVNRMLHSNCSSSVRLFDSKLIHIHGIVESLQAQRLESITKRHVYMVEPPHLTLCIKESALKAHCGG